jgi:hypothetical protein
MSGYNLRALLLGSIIVGHAVSSCGTSSLRTVTPPNAPPDISVQIATDSPAHRGLSIGGYRHSGHEIVAAADGAVVLVRRTHVRIHHGTDSGYQEIALQPSDYWFGIDEYKANLEKGLDVGPFAIACFDPSVNYPNEPVRFTYPVRCKQFLQARTWVPSFRTEKRRPNLSFSRSLDSDG